MSSPVVCTLLLRWILPLVLLGGAFLCRFFIMFLADFTTDESSSVMHGGVFSLVYFPVYLSETICSINVGSIALY